MMNRDAAEVLSLELALQMSTLTEVIAPVFEAGSGLRRQLEADGWSPSVAEAMAAQVVAQVLGQMTPARREENR